MQTRLAAAAHATSLMHAVLLSEDLFTQALCPWLDADSKAALRGVSKAMCSLVDGSITRVVSQRQGFVAADLTVALLAWPAVRHLTLLNVGSAANVVPLSTASLAVLKSLTVRKAPQAGALVMPTPSSNVAATIRVIDISGCRSLRSIEFVGSCAQLRSVRHAL
ncbi:hypothetical protein FOA52_010899 [Chlamydomonas sp. UWO 241]|nr:hypothetical protein FOA52_010899 [Chlamydomonas sp. UWO 241]